MVFHNLLTHLNRTKDLGGSLDRIRTTISSNISLNVVIPSLLISLFPFFTCKYERTSHITYPSYAYGIPKGVNFVW